MAIVSQVQTTFQMSLQNPFVTVLRTVLLPTRVGAPSRRCHITYLQYSIEHLTSLCFEDRGPMNGLHSPKVVASVLITQNDRRPCQSRNLR